MRQRRSEKMVVRAALNDSIDRELEIIDCFNGNPEESAVIAAKDQIKRCRDILEKYFGSRKTYKELWWDEIDSKCETITLEDLRKLNEGSS